MCYEKWVLLWKVESLTKSGLLYKNLCMLLKVTCFITLYKMILAMKSDMCLGHASDFEQGRIQKKINEGVHFARGGACFGLPVVKH